MNTRSYWWWLAALIVWSAVFWLASSELYSR